MPGTPEEVIGLKLDGSAMSVDLIVSVVVPLSPGAPPEPVVQADSVSAVTSSPAAAGTRR
ncbi:hypothetical protein GCM10009823_28580 [Brevibacterium salitolerans]|uniref:Uncharacterized protein n=1 Tax=Brevibacterium salitolerans TaxID=1403566 RepID=A0ABP5IS22_9MICO